MMTAEDIGIMSGFCAPERVCVGAEINEDYCHDEMSEVVGRPELLLRVISTEEVLRVLTYANAHHIHVTVRGSGTGLVGGAVPLYGGVLLETTLMNRILELDEENLTVTVEAGALLMDIASFVEAHGLLYPPDPGEKSATIGGNISTNAGGMRAVKYGVTRDYVRGLTAVLPTGEVVQLGGKVAKNSSGYALKDLLVGSEGTLAVVTRAVLRLVPLPAVSISALIPFPELAAAVRAVPTLLKSREELTAIEVMERDTILFAEKYLGKRFPDTKSPSYLLLTLDGVTRPQVDEAYARIAELCLSLDARDVLLVDTAERKESVWNARGAFLEAIKASTTAMDECDVVVPRSSVADFILYTHELARALQLRIPSFGHAGDGNLHVYLCRDALDEASWEQKRAAAFDAMYKRAGELGGLVSGEHGIGRAKLAYFKAQSGADMMGLTARIKKAFDPNGILNAGKIVG